MIIVFSCFVEPIGTIIQSETPDDGAAVLFDSEPDEASEDGEESERESELRYNSCKAAASADEGGDRKSVV